MILVVLAVFALLVILVAFYISISLWLFEDTRMLEDLPSQFKEVFED